MPEYATDHDLLSPAVAETETTSNKTTENLLEDQLFGNDDVQESNEIANSTAADIKQQLSTL